jgi:hypothetical protein
MQQHEQVVDILSDTKEKIKALLSNPEDANHSLKITSSIQREIDYISLVTGVAGNEATASTPTNLMPPAQTLFGDPLEVNTKAAPVTNDELKPEAVKVDNLKAAVIEASKTFLTTESSDIIANMDDLVIRGVAKKYNMPVTKDEPARLTIEFIEEIKAAITKDNEEQAERLSQKHQALKDTVATKEQALKDADQALETAKTDNKPKKEITRLETAATTASGDLEAARDELKTFEETNNI